MVTLVCICCLIYIFKNVDVDSILDPVLTILYYCLIYPFVWLYKNIKRFINYAFDRAENSNSGFKLFMWTFLIWITISFIFGELFALIHIMLN